MVDDLTVRRWMKETDRGTKGYVDYSDYQVSQSINPLPLPPHYHRFITHMHTYAHNTHISHNRP